MKFHLRTQKNDGVLIMIKRLGTITAQTIFAPQIADLRTFDTN